MTAAAFDRCDELRAPAHWQTVDFISDLHLQPAEPRTVAAWRAYLSRAPEQRADALFILGDLFEVWVGDDLLDEPGSFASNCAAALLEHSHSTPTFFLCGNRDFLLGERALKACGIQGLSDPTVLEFQQQRWLLSHGDELCLEDTEYLAFRAQVRSPAWQAAFLDRPLTERLALARDMRQRSEARKRSMAHDPALWADVDADAARAWLHSTGANTLIHGHTHRPASHDLGTGLQRVVLSDWDASSQPSRLEVLRLSSAGPERLTLTCPT
jgi:UDP-2,3-diacylglucosamine hydrolase